MRHEQQYRRPHDKRESYRALTAIASTHDETPLGPNPYFNVSIQPVPNCSRSGSSPRVPEPRRVAALYSAGRFRY